MSEPNEKWTITWIIKKSDQVNEWKLHCESHVVWTSCVREYPLVLSRRVRCTWLYRYIFYVYIIFLLSSYWKEPSKAQLSRNEFQALKIAFQKNFTSFSSSLFQFFFFFFCWNLFFLLIFSSIFYHSCFLFAQRFFKTSFLSSRRRCETVTGFVCRRRARFIRWAECEAN